MQQAPACGIIGIPKQRFLHIKNSAYLEIAQSILSKIFTQPNPSYFIFD
jgi:hypothetical protein